MSDERRNATVAGSPAPARVVDAAELVRPELRALPAYRLADAGACRWKLDQNESPWEPRQRVKNAAARTLRGEPWNRYPEVDAPRLRERLGALNGWPAEGVLLGNGSNELLQLALLALAAPGREVLSTEPSFGLYRAMIATAAAVPRFLRGDSLAALPIDELRAEIARDPTRPVVLCAPNNPTGAAPTVEEIDALLGALAAPLLLDNAYGELCRFDYRPLLARHPHLLIFRTLSKVWALAGERVGYLLGAPSLVRELAKVKLPYNLSRPATTLALATLADDVEVARRIRLIAARREQWRALLASAGLEVLPSQATFLLVRCASAARAAELRAALLAESVRVRDFGHVPGLEGCMRITVGPGGALRATDRALRRFSDDDAAKTADGESVADSRRGGACPRPEGDGTSSRSVHSAGTSPAPTGDRS